MTKYLFPNRWRPIGVILTITSFLLGFKAVMDDWEPSFFNWKVFALANEDIFADGQYFVWIETNTFNEIMSILFILGLGILAFSKERVEDEYIQGLRLNALMWATYANYIILVLAILFLYGLSFYYIMLFNLFTIPVIFILRYYYLQYVHKNSLSHEE